MLRTLLLSVGVSVLYSVSALAAAGDPPPTTFNAGNAVPEPAAAALFALGALLVASRARRAH